MNNKDTLMDITQSAITLSQSSFLPELDTSLTNFLYHGDTVLLAKKSWGLYDVITLNVKYGRDSLRKAFLLGEEYVDSTVLYVADEDRNLSVSGETKITGLAYIPQAGILPAYVDGNYYKGIEKIVNGQIKYSKRELPIINSTILESLYKNDHLAYDQQIKDTPTQFAASFFSNPWVIHSSQPIDLSNIQWSGNMIIRSDSMISIDHDCTLNNIICIAPTIKIATDFKGTIQLFAQDSIFVGDNCELQYPSSLVLYPKDTESRSNIKIGNNVSIAGTVLLFEDSRSPIPHLIDLGNQVTIQGDLIAFGLLKYGKNMIVNGSTYCYRFVHQTNTTLYENYLIDIDLNKDALSPFFLRSTIWSKQPTQVRKKILTWLPTKEI